MKSRLKVEILQEEYLYESPRDWDNLSTMVCSHRRYELGDVQLPAWVLGMAKSWDKAARLYLCDMEGALETEECDKLLTHYLIVPLYLLDHSGLRISTTSFGDPWDSGQIGFAFLKDEVVKQIQGPEEHKDWRKRGREIIDAEVETYDQYLRGDVWYYVITDPVTGDILDALHGLYGHEYAEQMAEQARQYQLEKIEAQYTEQWLKANEDALVCDGFY